MKQKGSGNMGTVFSLIFIVGGLYVLWDAKAFHKVPNQVFVLGDIVDLKFASRRSGDYAILKYSVNGQEYMTQSNSSSPFFNVGNHLKVFYDASNPSNCYTKPTMDTYGTSCISLTLGFYVLYISTIQFLFK